MYITKSEFNGVVCQRDGNRRWAEATPNGEQPRGEEAFVIFVHDSLYYKYFKEIVSQSALVGMEQLRKVSTGHSCCTSEKHVADAKQL